MRAAIDRTQGSFGVAVNAETDNTISGKRIGIVMPMSTRINDNVLAAGVLISGPARWEAARGLVHIDHGDFEVLGKWIVPIRKWRQFGIKKKVRALSEPYASGDEYALLAAPGKD